MLVVPKLEKLPEGSTGEIFEPNSGRAWRHWFEPLGFVVHEISLPFGFGIRVLVTMNRVETESRPSWPSRQRHFLEKLFSFPPYIGGRIVGFLLIVKNPSSRIFPQKGPGGPQWAALGLTKKP